MYPTSPRPSRTRGREPPRLPHRPRLSSFQTIGEWLDFLSGNGLSDDTVEGYGSALVKMCVRLRLEPAEISESILMSYLASRNPKGSSAEQIKSAAKSYFRWATRRGHQEEDPALDLRYRKPKYPPAVALSRSEYGRAMHELSSHSDPRRMLSISLLLETGARIGSMAAVTPDDAGTRAGELICFNVAKGDRPYAVPLTPAAAECVVRLLPRSNGTLIGRSKNTLWSWWHRAARRAGLPRSKWRAHILRDTFATNLLASGVDVRVVQELLNHADLSQMHRYAAVTDTRRRAALRTSVEESFPE
jgi:integrase/recombinase XerD